MKCTSISLCSLFENNKDIEDLRITIMSSDVSEANIKKINDLAKCYNRDVKIIDASDQLESFAKSLDLKPFRGSYAVYASLILEEILPEVDKVLMIDSDTLVVGSIRSLWQLSLEGNVMAAVPEIGLYSKISSSEDYDVLYKSDLYFNTGVILYDLKAWRENKIGNIISECIRKHNKEFKIVDQTILNLAINDKIYPLELKYNYYTAVHGIKYKTMRSHFPVKSVFSEVEFSDAHSSPVIIHFVGFPFERPWFRKGQTPYKDVYISYLQKTSWKDEPLEEYKKNKNFVFLIYDEISVFLRKHSFYNFYHWYRYVFGQYIKKLTRTSR